VHFWSDRLARSGNQASQLKKREKKKSEKPGLTQSHPQSLECSPLNCKLFQAKTRQRDITVSGTPIFLTKENIAIMERGQALNGLCIQYK
jgi:hypothetical protein